MKKSIMLILTFLLLLSTNSYSSDDSSPSDVINSIHQYVSVGKQGLAFKLLSKERFFQKEDIQSPDDLLTVPPLLNRHKEQIKKIDIMGVKNKGDEAMVKYIVVYNNGESEKRMAFLVLEEGNWRLAKWN